MGDPSVHMSQGVATANFTIEFKLLLNRTGDLYFWTLLCTEKRELVPPLNNVQGVLDFYDS